MAENSSKRRKLEHNSSEEDEDMENEELEQESEAAEEKSAEEDTKSKRKNPVSKNTSKVNFEAVYAGGMHKTAIFKLQIDDLLADVRPNYEKYSSIINSKLHEIKGLIESIPNREPLSVSVIGVDWTYIADEREQVQEATELMRKTHKIAIPYPDPKPNPNALYKLAYTRPAGINVAGSYILKTMVKSESTMTVDMVVTMPESIFQDKDYLNYRYFYKRAYYLSCIAAGLQESEGYKKSLQFEFLNGNSLQPILVLKCDTSK